MRGKSIRNKYIKRQAKSEIQFYQRFPWRRGETARRPRHHTCPGDEASSRARNGNSEAITGRCVQRESGETACEARVKLPRVSALSEWRVTYTYGARPKCCCVFVWLRPPSRFSLPVIRLRVVSDARIQFCKENYLFILCFFTLGEVNMYMLCAQCHFCCITSKCSQHH